MIVDSSYRWIVTIAVAVALTIAILPGAYRSGFLRKYPAYGMGLGISLVAAGLVLSRLSGESFIDALLLRAVFGGYVPDTGIHGYGWFLVLGYSIVLSNITVLIAGEILVAAGRVPPWISKSKGE